tara:strand:- start:457 stop:1230 length:774 start_codon:yes stop_codon:yes gene_type:complete
MVLVKKGEGKKKVKKVKTFTVPFALDEIKTNITINTNSPSKTSKKHIINQAIQFHLKGNIPEASKCYQYCITQGFNDHRIFSNYGAILSDLGKSQEAEKWFRKAIEIKPDYAEAHYNLGNILNDLGNLQDAEKWFRKAIEIKPDYAEAHSNLGNILKDLGKSQEAEVSTRKAIEIKPDYAEAHYNLGIILKDLGKSDQALLCFELAINIDKNLRISLTEIGGILLKKGKHLDGIKKLREGNGSIIYDYNSNEMNICS